jgi:hypothetical protein
VVDGGGSSAGEVQGISAVLAKAASRSEVVGDTRSTVRHPVKRWRTAQELV